MTGTLGECISHVQYTNKLNKPVKWDLYVMTDVREYDWWPESENRSRKWVQEQDLKDISLSSLTESHITSILKYIHSHLLVY